MDFITKVKDWISEKSTQLGIITIAGIAGYNVAPDQLEWIVLIMGILSGFVLFFNKNNGAKPDLPGAIGYLKGRLSEANSKAAIVGLAALAGYYIAPEQIDMIVTGLGLIGGVMAIFTKEKKPENP